MAVMIDDLVLQGVTEPYRMLTARAEYRLRLRADNASTRLTPIAIETGCVARERADWFADRQRARSSILSALEVVRSSEDLARAGIEVRRDGTRQSLFSWLRFPNISLDTLRGMEELEACFRESDPGLLAEIEEDARYAPYLERQESELRDLRANEQIALGDDLDYARIAGLSNEMVERLTTARPDTLAAASRIRGITPAALAAILVHARRRDARSLAA